MRRGKSKKTLSIIVLIIIFFTMNNLKLVAADEETTVTSTESVQERSSEKLTQTTSSEVESTKEEETEERTMVSTTMSEKPIISQTSETSSSKPRDSEMVETPSRYAARASAPIGNGIKTEAELIAYLESSEKVGYLENNITLHQIVDITQNKQLNMNGKLITVGDGSKVSPLGQFHLVGSSMTEFIIENGQFEGGDTRGLLKRNDAIGLISVDDETGKGLTVTIKNIKHHSKGGFFKGQTSHIMFEGIVTLENDEFNVRALNMDFKSGTVFTGKTYSNSNPGISGNSNGGLNLSFDRGKKLGVNGKRVVNIEKGASVVLENTNDKALDYANNIANFSQINIKGKLEATAYSPPLRTMMSQDKATGLPNNRSEVNVEQGSVFKLENNNSNGRFGVLYTYNSTMTIDNPKEYDLMTSTTKPDYVQLINSNDGATQLILKNTNIGVWNKAENLEGAPTHYWQGINELRESNVLKPTAQKTNDSTDFMISDYKRLSNNFPVPNLKPDNKYMRTNPDRYVIPNNEVTFFGTAMYYQPNDLTMNRPIVGATTSLTIDSYGVIPTVKTNGMGEWIFNDLALATIKGGTKGTIELKNNLQTLSKVDIEIEDKLPPKVISNVIKIPVGDTTILQNPKLGLETYSDETTSRDKLTVEVMTLPSDLTDMVKEVGVYTVMLAVTDEAGNTTTVEAPVIVHKEGDNIAEGFVTASDFRYDYRTWLEKSDAERKKIILKEAKAKGYRADKHSVTEIFDKMKVSWIEEEWKANDQVNVTIEVNGFKLPIKVTLTSNDVQMKVKHLYANTEEPIIANLETNEPVKNSSEFAVSIGQKLDEIVSDLEKERKIIVNYEGYSKPAINDYEVEGEAEKYKDVPNHDFTVIFYYTGELTLESVPDLGFEKIELSSVFDQLYPPAEGTPPIKIVNTVNKQGWALSVSLEDGLKNDSKTRLFRGELLYDELGLEPKTIGSTMTEVVTKGGDAPPITTVNVKGTTNQTGFKLRQFSGNYKDDYQGTLLWSLNDGPKP